MLEHCVLLEVTFQQSWQDMQSGTQVLDIEMPRLPISVSLLNTAVEGHDGGGVRWESMPNLIVISEM